MDILTHLASNLWELWLVLAVALLILELLTGGLYFICFTVGALAATIVAFITDSITAQLLTWAVASALSIFFIRPVMKNYLHREEQEKASNADAIIGRTGIVSETIVAGGYGRVAIDGDDWKAQASDAREIPEGTKVTVISRESIILTVE